MSLVLTPTRELAMQIGKVSDEYGRHTGMRHAVIYGGVSQKPQEQSLQKGVDILVATPGRLLDLMGQKLINLSTVEIFVLDEADRMLDMGFIVDIRRIIEKLPRETADADVLRDDAVRDRPPFGHPAPRSGSGPGRRRCRAGRRRGASSLLRGKIGPKPTC